MRKIAIAAVSFCLSSGIAGASTIDFLGMGNYETVTLGGVRSGSVWAGEIKWAWLTGNPTGSSDPFYTYCVNLQTNAVDGEQVTLRSTTEMVTATTDGAAKASWLFNTYSATVRAATGAMGAAAMGAGLQLAIWEVLYDNTLTVPLDGNRYDISAGSFYVASASGGAKTVANDYLKSLSSANYAGSSAGWLDAPAPLNGVSRGQDQITSVPEPATLLLLGTGLLGVAAARRKKSVGSPAL